MLQAQLEKGGKRKPFWILGPCVLETPQVTEEICTELVRLREKLDLQIVFKASFDKANRTSASSFRGPGLQAGLSQLLEVKNTFGFPILTDIHEPQQASAIAEVADIIQIPAFLCRQTDLLEAACKTGRLVNVKKGQFLSPRNIAPIVEKLQQFGSKGFWITERGTSFGYERLVVDFAALSEMKKHTEHLIFDMTHSVQLPGGGQGVTGGQREAIPDLAMAASAIGVSGFFGEIHPRPSEAKSDAANAWPLDQLERLLTRCLRIAEASHGT